MKRYNFDEIIDRKGTDCFKWDALPSMYGRDDLTPMWVADMDFRSPDFVMEAIRRRCDHEVLGYTMPSEGYWRTVTAWLEGHYNIKTSKESLHFIPGIVAGIAYALLCLTQPSDKVLVTTPVYPPFLNLPKASGRTLVCSPLKINNGRFEIDFDDFERKAESCKVFIMSNPHNPAGTVWGTEVLQKIADICERHNVLVISDEIHADLTIPGHHHVSYSTVSVTAAKHSLTFMAPSKTFNIAGLGSSVCYIADEALRKRFFGWLDSLGVAGGNIFAFTAAEAAFKDGEDWLQQMLDYLSGNVQALDGFLRARMPKVKAVLPEASYLAWLDFSAYEIPHKELADLFINEARVAMNDGTTFAPQGRGPQHGGDKYQCCFRLNLGCPRAMLLDALDRIAVAINK
jgi:cystathionine beta-lyase